MKKTVLKPGENIALKIPPDEFEETVAFHQVADGEVQ